MRLTTRTNLAMRTLMTAAMNPGRLVRKTDVARVCNVSENHLAIVIQQLARSGLLSTVRGRRGGFTLGAPPEEIRVGAVFRQFESDAPFAECFGDANSCPLAGCCMLREALSDALDAFYARLQTITLADLIVDNAELESLLCLAARKGAAPVCTGVPA
ncbi:RrF2 family transcriptional regulator [Anianabacter salinae]|uniref:RrF2 family transcriptional regulator n=1 Tax=Anianabacter salinae TaxID=2851023 RepID=UPI00225E1002|nr:Rrf2 family transcriptional regulator [Anianabacter salinae]MBV0912346.1 Rrf2 family transcriptional regulator [Anianabacter salinae]